MPMNMYDQFMRTVSQYPEKTAIVEDGWAVSYQALDAVVSSAAGELARLGVAPGQMVGLCFANSVVYIALTYALWKIDAVVVPIDIDLKPDEIREVCGRMRVAALVHAKGGDDGWVSLKCPEIETPYYFKRMDDQAGDWADDQADGQGRHDTGIHMAFVRFTSGTTGKRKGVVLSHERIAERIKAVNRVLQITPDDVILWILPLSHHFVSTIVLYLANGATIVLAGGIWSRSMLEAINENHVTVLYGSPFHYALLAADASGKMMPDVRLAISTAIGLPAETHERFYGRFKLPLSQAYGIIEIGLVCINTVEPLQKPGSVGPVSPDYRVMMKNTHAYPETDGMMCGELHFSGPGFFDAYFDPWTDGKEIMIDGWFETGDIGGIDAHGFIRLLGRKNQVINMAGIKVFPGEIEAMLNRHPAVAESCVYGKPHERFGQIVAAVVVMDRNGPGADEAAIKAFCRKTLAEYKVPAQIDFTDHIEKTVSTGKIRRKTMENNV